MGDLSKNFSRWEFACKGENCCGHSAPISRELVDALQQLRDLIGKPLRVNSGFRCLTHNRAVGSRDTSQHCLGLAADIATPEGMTPLEFSDMAARIEAFQNGGMFIYHWGLHLDIRDERARGTDI